MDGARDVREIGGKQTRQLIIANAQISRPRGDGRRRRLCLGWCDDCRPASLRCSAVDSFDARRCPATPVVMFELLTGDAPHSAGNMRLQQLRRHATRRPQSVLTHFFLISLDTRKPVSVEAAAAPTTDGLRDDSGVSRVSRRACRAAALVGIGAAGGFTSGLGACALVHSRVRIGARFVVLGAIADGATDVGRDSAGACVAATPASA